MSIPRSILFLLARVYRKQLLLFLPLFLISLPAWQQSVIISEVGDPGDEYQGRYIQLYNPMSNAVDISGWKINTYYNGDVSIGCDVTIPSGTNLASGASYLIAYDQSIFDTEYSCSADQESGCIESNGDDVYELVDDVGDRVDIHGEVGVDGTGENWEFEDAIVERDPDICEGNTSYSNSEWSYTDPGNTGDGTPCSHSTTCECSHSISSFSPTEGCPDTGTVTVTINGSGFNDGIGTSDVQFDGASSPSFTVISNSEIEAELPSGATDGKISVVTDGCTVKSSNSFDVNCPECGQLFVNEFSNGESGQREYVELIVGNNCGGCYADIGGWIIDDNNGDFSGGASTGEGIAQGHLRFDPNAEWDSIPTGSIIVIYNPSDKNLTIDNQPLNDDPMDSNGDSVYVIPADDPNIQECSDIPNSSDGSYSPCSYSSTSGWTPASMSNSQDAMQTRTPDGDHFHGASYGSDAAFDGGPDGLHVHNSGGSDDVFYFGGTDPRDGGNWTQGTATSDLSTTDETPGSSNNSNNQAYIDGLKCTTLPIELVHFGGKAVENGNRIRWRTLSEVDHDRFDLEYRSEEGEFQTIARIEGKGDPVEANHYEHLHREAPSISYYRLKSVDRDGSTSYSPLIVVEREDEGELALTRRGVRYQVHLPGSAPYGELSIWNAYGQRLKVLSSENSAVRSFSMKEASNGVYFLRYRTERGEVKTRKFLH
jgi:hypothetical protein